MYSLLIIPVQQFLTRNFLFLRAIKFKFGTLSALFLFYAYSKIDVTHGNMKPITRVFVWILLTQQKMISFKNISK